MHQIDEGSFRDPKGRVYIADDYVYRTVMPVAEEDYKFVLNSGLMERLVGTGRLVGYKEVSLEVLGSETSGSRYVLEHPKLPFISHPYEWSFSALKAAALLQLDVILTALEHDVALSDATAYNIQFLGPNPIFIDHLSFRPYREGEYWIGHRQFCEQFLNPLLLRAKLGIPHNAWYRGSLEGIPTQDLKAMLPLKSKLGWNIFTHVVLQGHFQKASMDRQSRATVSSNGAALPKAAYQRMIAGLKNWIDSLTPPGSEKSVWGTYADDNSYKSSEAKQKEAFISKFASETKPAMLWDIGCNTGNFSKAALDAGAKYAIGFDFDPLALDMALSRAQKEQLNFLALFLDVANPTSDQGWAEAERKGLAARATADAVLALALVHHLAITRNVPLPQVVEWLVSLAPTGVVEFVPKEDVMVQELLRLREDIFDDYSEATFIDTLKRQANIVEMEQVSESGRKLVWYQRS